MVMTKEQAVERGLPVFRPLNECWEWTRSRVNGYGQTSGHGPAHRASYEVFVGPIPDGMKILHSCDNPPCCNPAHLSAGTAKDNSRDMVARERHYGGRNQPHHASTHHGVDIPDELWQALKIEAAVKGITIKELVRRLLSRKGTPTKEGTPDE